MKRLFLILTILGFTASAYAQETTEEILSREVDIRPDELEVDEPIDITGKETKYTAQSFESSDPNVEYKGRNRDGAVETSVGVGTSASSNLSRSIILTRENTEKTILIENLESTTAEFVQKIEEDRLDKGMEQSEDFVNKRNKLMQLYQRMIDYINVKNLGQEQDPTIESPFKCKDLENEDCAEGDSDPHNAASCPTNQRLAWDGSVWSCVGLFSDNPYLNCNTTAEKGKETLQYIKTVNGEKVCQDYIFSWVQSEFDLSKCETEGIMTATISCQKFKDINGNSIKTVDNSYCPGEKPDDLVSACIRVTDPDDDTECFCPEGTRYDFNNGNPVCEPDSPVKYVSHTANNSYSRVNMLKNRLEFKLYSPDGSCKYNKLKVNLDINDIEKLKSITLNEIWMYRGAWVFINGKIYKKRLHDIAGASNTPTGSGIGDKGFNKLLHPNTYFSGSSGNGSENMFNSPLLSGYEVCGKPYSSKGMFSVKGSNCIFSCDTKNEGSRSLSNASIPIDFFKEGMNTITFENVGSNATLLNGKITFNSTLEGDLPLPACYDKKD